MSWPYYRGFIDDLRWPKLAYRLGLRLHQIDSAAIGQRFDSGIVVNSTCHWHFKDNRYPCLGPR